jgi:hypothetical protein
MYKCIACLSYNIKKVKTARLTQKQIAKDSQAIPPPPPKQNLMRSSTMLTLNYHLGSLCLFRIIFF